jgi:hypothetical protein
MPPSRRQKSDAEISIGSGKDRFDFALARQVNAFFNQEPTGIVVRRNQEIAHAHTCDPRYRAAGMLSARHRRGRRGSPLSCDCAI